MNISEWYNKKMSVVNKTLLYMLIFTIVSSVIAYHMVVTAYDGVFELGYYTNF